jgi:hypothetical protein
MCKSLILLNQWLTLEKLFPLHSGAIFYPIKTVVYARKNEVCNFFATRRQFDSKICLANPSENQTPIAY